MLLIWAGCSDAPDYVVSRFDVTHVNWDTLRVDVDFAHHPAVGEAERARPDSMALFAFDAAYDTLYAGLGPRIPLPDARLGSRERVMVEVCGTFGRQRICEQEAVLASPKRLQVRHDIDYPERGRLDQGRYELIYDVERQVFSDDTAWEPIPWHRDVHGYLLAYIDGQQARAMRVPLSGRQGQFNLARAANYRDFRNDLDLRLLNEEEITIHLDLYAGLGIEKEQVASVEKHIRPKTDAERTYDVASFAEQAATQILSGLQVANQRRVRAYIDAWSYNKLNRRYTIEMEVQWGGTSFGAGRYRLHGVLEVGEDGREGAFMMKRANRRAERTWADVHQDPRFQLQPMDVEVEEVMETRDQTTLTTW